MNMQSKEARQGRRRQTYLTASIVIGAGKHNVWVRDISAGGAQIFFENQITVGQRVIFTLNNKQRGAVVRWVDHPLAGIEFESGPGVDMSGAARATAEDKRDAIRTLVRQKQSSGLSGWLKRLGIKG